MMNHPVHAHDCACFKWKPIVAGTLTAIGLSFLLNLFSMAIGLTVFTTDSQGVQNLALGGLVAMAIGLIASMFASGWLAGYLANRHCTKRHLGAFYGFLTWCLALVATIFLADYVHHYLMLYTQLISGVASQNVTEINNGVQITIDETTKNTLAVSAYVIFVLFFLSAFSASLGGHCGMRYINRDER